MDPPEERFGIKFRDFNLRERYISHFFPHRENREIKWE